MLQADTELLQVNFVWLAMLIVGGNLQAVHNCKSNSACSAIASTQCHQFPCRRYHHLEDTVLGHVRNGTLAKHSTENNPALRVIQRPVQTSWPFAQNAAGEAAEGMAGDTKAPALSTPERPAPHRRSG